MTKKSRRVAKARRALLALSLVLVTMLVAVGGTIAWLTDSTETVTNSFTSSNIDIWMTETKNGETTASSTEDGAITTSFQMIPGGEDKKDPKVVIEAGSEDCWVFVKITPAGGVVTADGKTTAFSDFVSYTVDTANWTAVTGASGVYYKKLDSISDSDNVTLNVLTSEKVTYPSTITKAMMDALEKTPAQNPQLIFQSWAVQQANLKDASGNAVTTAEAAWAIVSAD